MANFFTLIVKQHHLCFCVELIGGVTHDVYMYICIQRARSTWSTCCNAWRRRKSLANIIEVREKPIFLSNFVLLVYLASTAAALFVGFCIYPLPPHRRSRPSAKQYGGASLAICQSILHFAGHYSPTSEAAGAQPIAIARK